MLFTFILLAAIIIILSSNIANDMLKDRIESQFLSESSSRGEAIRLLMGIYLNQVNHLADRLSIDNEIREILVTNSQEKHRLSTDRHANSTILEQKRNEMRAHLIFRHLINLHRLLILIPTEKF